MQRRTALVLSTLIVALALTSSAGGATVGPSTHDYGGQTVGTTSAAVNFGLTTTPTFCVPDSMTGLCSTDTRFTVSTVELGGGPGTTVTSADYTTHNIDCPYPSMTSPALINGIPSFCHFEASFAPAVAGIRSRTLIFPEDNGGATATLTLTGTGLAVPSAPAPAPIHKKKCKKKHRTAAAAKKKCKKKR
jgi:hypothetical protein